MCREELWLGMEKANPVAVTGTRMGWLLNGIGLCQLGLGAAIGGIRVFEEVTAPIIEPELAILARLHGHSAH